MKKSKKVICVILASSVAAIFIIFLFFLASNNDKKAKFERDYNLKKYDSDKYSAQAKYDTQGNLEQAGQSDNSGTEDADWGEGVGMFHKIADNDGNILWEGISEDAYNKMSAKEQKEVTDRYSKVEEKILGHGSKDVSLNEDSKMEKLLYDGTPEENITSLCMKFNEGIPFSKGGRSYETGFDLQTDGFDNSDYPEGNGYGVDGPGYIIWLFRNALGYTPEDLKGEFSVKSFKQEISMDNLKTGDICITGNVGDNDIQMGVVAGFNKEYAVVSTCSNEATEKFPYGCNHLCYIRSQTDDILGNFDSVDFKRFYRIAEMEGK